MFQHFQIARLKEAECSSMHYMTVNLARDLGPIRSTSEFIVHDSSSGNGRSIYRHHPRRRPPLPHFSKRKSVMNSYTSLLAPLLAMLWSLRAGISLARSDRTKERVGDLSVNILNLKFWTCASVNMSSRWAEWAKWTLSSPLPWANRKSMFLNPSTCEIEALMYPPGLSSGRPM